MPLSVIFRRSSGNWISLLRGASSESLLILRDSVAKSAPYSHYVVDRSSVEPHVSRGSIGGQHGLCFSRDRAGASRAAQYVCRLTEHQQYSPENQLEILPPVTAKKFRLVIALAHFFLKATSEIPYRAANGVIGSDQTRSYNSSPDRRSTASILTEPRTPSANRVTK